MPRPKPGQKVLQVYVAEEALFDLELLAALSHSTPSQIVRVKLDELIAKNRDDLDEIKKMAARR